MVRQVQPLRISKGGNTPSSTPNGKMAPATNRPLSEIGSTERRRNSPSYNQATKKMIVSRESSPYTENSSPPSFLKPTASPRDFWSGRDSTMSPSRFDNSENDNSGARSPSPAAAPKRRPSVERLMQASRVRNSNIFALETKDSYDPMSLPIVERPSANRPLSMSFANNTFARADSMRKENYPLNTSANSSPQRPGHKRTGSEINIPTMTPSKSAASVPLPPSPEKQGSPSPTKSSLSRTSQFGMHSAFDPDTGAWSDGEERVPTPRALHRHAKSVTFHEDPPVINEYEHPTPEPSVSVASDREGSWDSDEYDDPDYSFERGSSLEPDRDGGNDDSFDADLENADKTPVVLPEDWSRMSPEEARTDLVNNEDDVFDEETGEATERGLPTGTEQNQRVASDGSESSRPLPPLPGFMRQERRNSGSLTSATEWAAHITRNLPSPPKRASCSKDEILKMTSRSPLTLQERLALMGGQQEERPSSKSSSSTATVSAAVIETEQELTITNLDTGEKNEIRVTETEVAEDSVVGHDMSSIAFEPPRISRESILRKVRNSKYEFEDFEDEEDFAEESEMLADSPARPSIAELARMDPDQPVPSRENSRDIPTPVDHRDEDEVKIKDEPVDDEDSAFDMHSIPAAQEGQTYVPPRSPSRMDDYDIQSSVLQHNMRGMSEDGSESASRYSSVQPDAESTVLHNREETVETDGKETLQAAMELLTVKDYGTEVTEPTKQGSGEFVGLPSYLGALGTDDFDFGMKEYTTSSPPQQKMLDAMKAMPQLQPTYTSSGTTTNAEISPPGTPDSVLRHDDEAYGVVSPIEDEQHGQRELPFVPERVASIKTPGGNLKTRQSGNQADLEAMAAQRRLVSADYPVPPIPQAYQGDASRGLDGAVNVGAEESERSSMYDEGPSSAEEKADSLVGSEDQDGSKADKDSKEFAKRRKSRKSGGKMDLCLDTSAFSLGETEGLGLEEEFERVIEGQKVGAYPFFSATGPAQYGGVAAQRDQGALQQLQPEQRFFVSHSPSPYRPHYTSSSSAGTNVSTRTQKGYLMRQNTKVVVATNRNFSGDSNDSTGTKATSSSSIKDDQPPMSPTAGSAPRPASKGAKSANGGSSPRKGSAEKFLKTEPWNGKTRRQSMRNASAQQSARAARRNEPVPPLPGQESAVVGAIDDDYAAGSASLEDEVGEGVERGRLFVKVVGVKELDLPLPKNDRVDFQLTLDNGLHCVTTSSLELGTTAPIGQEFELVVLNDLEFQLTLTTKLPPKPAAVQAPAPSSPTKHLKSKSSGGFSRFLSSPKKRAEKERQEREAAEAEERRRQQEEAARKRASHLPTAWDLMHDLVNGADGSFARAYVNLKAYEKPCFGRQLTVDVPCYNEWALEKDNQVINSVRSKRGANSGPVRRPPYVIGQLELQLLYVPKPRGATDDDMPKSMSGAAREMNKAREVKEIVHEGHLSQQGGDCQHWRRRFFRLQGPKLTAYHEHTHQKRAVINLGKASRVVDDKRTLVADPSSPTKSGGKGRRKSAFAEEDEGYQYVEEGFRIRFANGETIDFYADNRAAKDDWMVMLSQVIGKPDAGQKAATWTDLVLARERLNGAIPPMSPVRENKPEHKDFAHAPQRKESYRKPVAKSAPNSPMKGQPAAKPAPPVPSQTARPNTPPMNPRRGHRSRDAVKSMIF